MAKTTSLLPPAKLAQWKADYQATQDVLLGRFKAPVQQRWIRLKPDLLVHLLEAGSGDPVIFLHGGAGIGAEHIPIMSRLAKGHRVIIPDRPGHGLSDPFDYSRVDLRQANVEFIQALMDGLGIKRAALVGNSYGGLMAIHFALAHPERVTKLIVLSFFPGVVRWLPPMMRLMVMPVIGPLLGATVGRPSERNTRMFFGKLIVAHIDRMPDELVTLETMHGRRHKKSISSLFRAGIDAGGFRMRYLVRDELQDLQVPTAFVWGENDAFMTPDEGRAAAGLVPGSTFAVIKDAGHLPSTDQPEATAQRIEEALGAGRGTPERKASMLLH